ncbi:hypothetical protein BJF78_31190 [Pseudonocardia sp. CNS-139]|nr:hypothetical protein BJF78_31190 [Pseudonocardia sp. CNS-139]
MWWPWLLVWGATVALLAVAVAVVLTHRRDRRSGPRHSITIYLDESAVMDLYRQYGGKYKAALRHEVQERISSGGELEASAELAPLRARASRGVNSEVFRTYIEMAEPITVVSIIVDVLERAADIVDVDLTRQEVGASDALDRAFAGRPPAGGVRLREVDAFVSVLGRFRVAGRTADATTFEAPFGDPDDPGAAPKVRLVCAQKGLRTTVLPAGRARCLGLAGDWDAGTRTLTVHPIAVFR